MASISNLVSGNWDVDGLTFMIFDSNSAEVEETQARELS